MGIYRFKLPDIGEGVVEAEITSWHVKLGDTVEEDQPLADAMTDKATIELTSPVDGVIKTIACEEGDMLAVGADLVVLEIEGDGEDDDAEETEAAEAPTPKPAPLENKSTATPPPVPTAPRRTSDKVQASPAVRKRADAMNIDLADVPHAGARIEHSDLDAFLLSEREDAKLTSTQSAPAAPPEKPAAAKAESHLAEGETRIKVIGLRRVIAQRMQEAKRHIPHFTYVEEIDVTALEAFRARTNEKSADNKPKLTVLPLIIRALAETLKDWPQFNALYQDEAGYVSRFEDINLGIATQTDQGLIVPVLKRAQTLSMWQMANEIARLAEAARTNTLSTEDLKGATTTLTSLGPLGGIVTTPVINRPEVAIFGPNKIRKTLALEDGEIVERKVMNFSISCDHRVIDGYDAAAMMAELRARLEDPARIFLL
ncbi:dihydrolipoamide acetyltransferase family protein [Litorimonas sp. RW-G-Af-16]|uniref:dihydrolipoamide acetyltransferase family protein n=1 Tax=Litorimonas sp. RW-G-Af-16 TaxID=3241168 RepID=UPI00390C788E